MAIRKDIDDMLNNLKSGKPLESPKTPTPKPIPKLSDSKINKMSVDDLLSSITSDKSEKNSAPEASENSSKPKKKIIISHELPDYEAIRAEEQQKEKKAADEAKKARIEAEKKAAEEAEKARIESEKKAAEEAKKARIESEKKAAEEAKKARIEAEKKAAEEAEKARIEAEKKAAEEAEKARIEAEKKAAEKAEKARIKAEKKAAEKAEKARIEAEKKAAEEAEKARIEAEKKAEEENQSDAFSEESVAAYSNADIEEADESDDNIEEVPKKKKHSFFKKKNSEPLEGSDDFDDDFDDEPDSYDEKKTNKFTSVLKNILDEDPEEIINQRKEQNDSDDKPRKGRVKKGFYAVFGVIFALLACVGLVTVITRGISMFGSYTSGESRKEGFEDVIYPAVIMDIESFNSPAELSSEQIITAAIWSMILTDGVTEQYELTFDVVIIPAADVESYAVKLFGDALPKLEHTTVGPAESRFYYNEETKSYNVPVAPVTYTYAPEIREASKSGNEYTVIVDYIDELPSWLPKTSSKSVQYVLTEANGSYQIKSMKILSTNTNAV